MKPINRRSFLITTPIAAGLAMEALTAWKLRASASSLISSNDKLGYGELKPAKARNSGELLLARRAVTTEWLHSGSIIS
jgi:hypothetical protein